MNDPKTEHEVQVLLGLRQSEITANVGELQVTTTMAVALLTYLAATIFTLRQLDSDFLPFLGLPVVFLCCYQLLRATVVIRRAVLARVYEDRLLELAGQTGSTSMGSRFYGAIDDVGVIIASDDWFFVKPFRLAIALVAYFGLYLCSILYCTYINWVFLGKPHLSSEKSAFGNAWDGWSVAERASVAGYLGVGAIFLLAAVTAPSMRRKPSIR